MLIKPFKASHKNKNAKILCFSSNKFSKTVYYFYFVLFLLFLAKSGTLDFIQKTFYNIGHCWRRSMRRKLVRSRCCNLQATASSSAASHCVLLIEKLFLLIVCCSANIVVAVAMKSVADAVVVVVKVLPKPSLI